jgi:hypothetical protein
MRTSSAVLKLFLVLVAGALTLGLAAGFAPPEPEGPKKWEYRVLSGSDLIRSLGEKSADSGRPPSADNKRDLELALNRLGSEGWELCAVHSFESTARGFQDFYLKRPK